MEKTELIATLTKKYQDDIDYLQSELSIQMLTRFNYIVVSTDYIYTVHCNNKDECEVKIDSLTPPAFSKETATHIANSFCARNGKGKIEWQPMLEKEYQRTMLKEKTNLLNSIKEMSK